jgi:hypothetical protein
MSAVEMSNRFWTANKVGTLPTAECGSGVSGDAATPRVELVSACTTDAEWLFRRTARTALVCSGKSSNLTMTIVIDYSPVW